VYAGFHSLLVEKGVSLRKGVFDEGRLNDIEHLVPPLPSTQFHSPDEYNSVTDIRSLKSYHQANVAFEMLPDSLSQFRRFSNIKRGNECAETTSKNVDARLV
jgi:hypothetical protein